MATVKAPKTEMMDAIDFKSIVSYQIFGTDVTFYNRAGDPVGTFPIRMPNYAFTPAIMRMGSVIEGYRDILVKEWSSPLSANAKLPNPAALPSEASLGSLVWSPDGSFLLVGSYTDDTITVYQRTGDVFEKKTNLAGTGATETRTMEFSPDGKFLAYACAGPAGGFRWKRREINNTYTALTNPASSSLGSGVDVAWSPDGLDLAVVTAGLNVYRRSESSLSEVINLTGFTSPKAVAWHPTSQYLAFVDGTGSSALKVYRRASTSSLTLLASQPTSSTGARMVRWSPNGKFLALGIQSTPYIRLYRQDGETFTLLANPAELPPNVVTGISWTPDSKYMAVTSNNSPWVVVYAVSSDGVMTRIPFAGTAATAAIGQPKFSPDAKHLALSYDASPFISIYKSALNPIPGLATRIE